MGQRKRQQDYADQLRQQIDQKNAQKQPQYSAEPHVGQIEHQHYSGHLDTREISFILSLFCAFFAKFKLV
jgi:hypothetical protein